MADVIRVIRFPSLFPACIMCSQCLRAMGVDGKPKDWGKFSGLRDEIRDFDSREAADNAAKQYGWEVRGEMHFCPRCVFYRRELSEGLDRCDFPEAATLAEAYVGGLK